MSRRSKKKGCNPLVAVLVLGCLFLVALVVVLFGGKMALEKWVQGDGFKEWVRGKAATTLKADVQIDEVTWEGLNTNIGKVSARGYEDASFSKIDMQAIRASMDKVANKTVYVSDINVTRADIEFSDERIQGNSPVQAVAVDASGTAQAAESSKIPGWLERWVPDKVQLGDIIISSVRLAVKGENPEEVLFSINEAKAQITPDLSSGNAEIRIKEGDMLITKAPEMKIREAKLRWQDGSLFVNNAGIGIYDEGHISGMGEIAFKDQTNFKLDLNISDIDVKKVVPEDWQKRISGTVRGPVKVSGPIDNLVQSGTIHLDDGILEGVDFLKKIATFTRSDRFSRIVLNEAQSDFAMQGEKLSLTNIQIQSDDLMRIEGKVDKEGKAISGVLQVGVTPSTIRLIPNAQEQVFNTSRDGFVWTTVTLGGTTDKISEDLSSRLLSAATGGLVDNIPQELKDLLGLGGGDTPANPDGSKSEDENGVGGLIRGVIKDRIEDNSETIDKAKKVFDLLGPLLGR